MNLLHYNIMGDKLILHFYNFTPEITKLLWQRPIAQYQDVTDEDVLCRTTAILEIFIEDTIGSL